MIMPRKKKKEIKGFPMVLPRPPKSKKLTAEFAKKNPKKGKLKIDTVVEKQKNVIEPFVKQLDDGTCISTQSGEKFEDLFHLIANLK